MNKPENKPDHRIEARALLGLARGSLGSLAERWTFMIAIAIFLVAALTTSQSAATRTMVPLGLALGIGAGYMIAMWTAVVGVLFLPANGTQIAAAEADTTGTTTLGKRVFDHEKAVLLVRCVLPSAHPPKLDEIGRQVTLYDGQKQRTAAAATVIREMLGRMAMHLGLKKGAPWDERISWAVAQAEAGIK